VNSLSNFFTGPMRVRNIAVLAVLAIAGVIGFRVLQPSGPKQTREAAIPVSVEKASRQTVPVYRYGYGTVKAFNFVTLKVRVDGTLEKVLFREGQNVHVGDVLAQIDPRPYQAALNQATAKKAQDDAQLIKAKSDLTRFQALTASQFASRQNLEAQEAMVAQLEAAIKSDDAAIENARVQLGYTTITAPINGRIGLRQVDVGNILHAVDQIGLATISQVHPISATFSLPATELTAISKAGLGTPMPVQAYTSDDKEKLAEGELLTVDNTVDEATGTIKLKATFPNEDDHLWPGESISAHLLLGTARDALTVPARAVQRGPTGLFVYVVQKDNTAAMRPIETTETFGDYVVVVSANIAEGDPIVVNGQSRLQPGSKVTVIAEPGKADKGGDRSDAAKSDANKLGGER
jgi:multidrug efflux system membrane fusion protein